MRSPSRFSTVDKSRFEELVESNQPCRLETVSGRVFEVPHRDFLAFNPKRTAVIITYAENRGDHFAVVPLLTVTSAMAKVG